MKNKIKKIRKTKMQQFADSISHLGTIDKGCLSDGSGCWVELTKGLDVICFSFDGKQKDITGISICKNIMEVTDTKIIAQF